MSTLYELPGGGVGHYDDLFRAHMMLVMKHLSLGEIRCFACDLTRLPNAYYGNEKDILEGASIALEKADNGSLSPAELEGAMAKIADMARIKKRHGKDGIAEKTEKLLLRYIETAAEKGYKDPSGFFSLIRA